MKGSNVVEGAELIYFLHEAGPERFSLYVIKFNVIFTFQIHFFLTSKYITTNEGFLWTRATVLQWLH